MKLPRFRLSRPVMLLLAGLYLLAGISLVRLLPWIDTLATRRSEDSARSSSDAPATSKESKTSPRLPIPGFDEIDFSNPDQPITLEIAVPNQRMPLKIQFSTGKRCNFEDHRACAHTYQTDTGQPVVFLTIHSGMDGEAERFRHYLEGTGINQAGTSLKKVRAVMKDLRGAEVTLRQGGQVLTGLELGALGRVPPRGLEAYFAAPYRRALNVAAASDASLDPYVYPDQPLIVFETCGWRMPGEKSSPAASDTTGSIYVAVIHARQK